MTLDAHSLTIHFGGLRALADVSLRLERGRILGLIGPNGAGKSTLFNCLTGVVQPEGHILVDGKEVTRLRTDERIRCGISRTFQMPRLDMSRSVLDAVMLGFTAQLDQGRLASFFGLPEVALSEERLKQRALDKINWLGLSAVANERAGSLSLGQLRLIEVARALAAEPKYLLLDEPAAGLDENDRTHLARAIRTAAAAGIGVALIEHNVGFVAELSDEMLALMNGRIVARGEPGSVVQSDAVIEAYLGPAYAQ